MDENTKAFNMEIFSERLKSLLTNKDLTLEKVGSAIGITRQTLSKYTDGKAKPTIENIYNIAQFFNVSADYLLGIETDSVKATQEMLVNKRKNELLDKIIAFCTELKK